MSGHDHGMQGAGAPAGAQAPAKVPAWKLLATLGGAGAMAGLLIVLVWRWTTPTIEAYRAATVEKAIGEVLKHPATWDTLFLVDGKLVRPLPAGVDVKKVEQLYEGFSEGGRRVGVAITAAEPGFQDLVSLIIGYDPQSHALLAMQVLADKETPGLGDRIGKDSTFGGQFPGAVVPLKGVKGKSGKDPSEVDVITGATISSRTVIRIINNAVARWTPLLATYDSGAKP